MHFREFNHKACFRASLPVFNHMVNRKIFHILYRILMKVNVDFEFRSIFEVFHIYKFLRLLFYRNMVLVILSRMILIPYIPKLILLDEMSRVAIIDGK